MQYTLVKINLALEKNIFFINWEMFRGEVPNTEHEVLSEKDEYLQHRVSHGAKKKKKRE